MKILQVSVLFILFIFNLAFSQNTLQDVVYLKNGSIIRGLIIEQVPNKVLKIKTADNSVFVYEFEEIEKITKEEITIPKSETKNSNSETNPSLKKAFQSTYLSKSYFGVVIGGSFPTGQYKASDDTSKVNSFAKPGLCLILKGNVNLIKYLGLGYSIGGNIHFFDNTKYESFLRNDENVETSFNSNPYISYFGLIGPVLKLPIIDELIIEFSPEIGFMGGISPMQKLSINQRTYYWNGSTYVYDWVNTSSTKIEAQNKFGFAYQIDVGLRINLNDGFAVKLGFNYLESKMTFDQKYTTSYPQNPQYPTISGTLPSNEIIYKSKNPYLGLLFLL